jgi:hypothetical protein
MYKLLMNYAILIISGLSCESEGKGMDKALPIVYEQKAAYFSKEAGIAYDIRNSKGVVVVHAAGEVSKRLTLYDESGNIWTVFSFNGNLSSNLSNIQPLAKDADTYLLAFNCIGITDKYYKVIVNESSKDVKYIKVKDTSFQLKTWQGYILTCFSVYFDFEDNHLKSSPSDNAKEIFYSKDGIYHPVKFQGYWVQLKWGDETNWHYGWVRWRKNNALILELLNN